MEGDNIMEVYLAVVERNNQRMEETKSEIDENFEDKLTIRNLDFK